MSRIYHYRKDLHRICLHVLDISEEKRAASRVNFDVIQGVELPPEKIVQHDSDIVRRLRVYERN